MIIVGNVFSSSNSLINLFGNIFPKVVKEYSSKSFKYVFPENVTIELSQKHSMNIYGIQCYI